MIKIVNDFFDKEQFKKIQNHILKLSFTPCFFKDKPPSKENYFGARYSFRQDLDLLNMFVKQAEDKFKIKINNTDIDSGIDLRNVDRFNPHDDADHAVTNILIMLKGPKAVTNGTVFYTDNELDMHIGFKENRSIMFPSNWIHSNHASNVPNLRRYTSTLFVKDYEDLV